MESFVRRIWLQTIDSWLSRAEFVCSPHVPSRYCSFLLPSKDMHLWLFVSKCHNASIKNIQF